MPRPLPRRRAVRNGRRYDPLFEKLKTEVLKLTAHSSLEGGVDWKSVQGLGLEILDTKSKDLTVASYLTLALFMLDGYGGLADGLAILQNTSRTTGTASSLPPPARATGRSPSNGWSPAWRPFIDTKAPEPFEIALLRPCAISSRPSRRGCASA